MPSSYTTNLGIEKPATGEQSGTWGDTVNLNYDLFDQAINGVQSVTLAAAGSSGSPRVLAITDGTVSEGRNKFIEFVDGGDLGATAYVQLTPNDAEKVVHIRNSLSANRSVIVFQGTYNASNDFEIPNGKDVVLKFDGAGSGAVVADVFVDLQVTGLTAGTADINGGTLDGAVIGGSSAAAATVTDLTASGTVDFNGATVSDLGTVTTADINGGTIDGVTIGGTSAGAATFTSLTASGDASITSGSGTPLAISGASPGDRALITSSDGTITGVFGASPPESNVRIGSQSNHEVSIVVNNTEVGSFTTSGAFSFSGNVSIDTDTLFVDAGNDRVGIGTSSPNAPLHAVGDDNNAIIIAESTDADATQGPIFLMYRSSASPADGDELGSMFFRGRNDASQDVDYAVVRAEALDVTDGTEDGALEIDLIVNGVASPRARLTPTGLGIGTTNPAEKLDVAGNAKASGSHYSRSGTTSVLAIGASEDLFTGEDSSVYLVSVVADNNNADWRNCSVVIFGANNLGGNPVVTALQSALVTLSANGTALQVTNNSVSVATAFEWKAIRLF